MIKTILLSITFILLQSNCSVFAQKKAQEYFAVYKTEVKSKLKINFKLNQPVTKEDSLLNEFSEHLMKELAQKDIMITIVDSLRTSNDTTFFTSDYLENSLNEPGINLNINAIKAEKILVQNKFLIKNDSTGLFQGTGEYEIFNFTSNGEDILRYKTSIFQNRSGTIKIWVCKDLPGQLNPAIMISNPTGAILKYEMTLEDQTTTSIVESIAIIPKK